MINENFVFLGALFSIAGAVSYIRDTLKGKTKPNRTTWFLWALAPLIAFSAEVQAGVGIKSLMTFMVGFNPLLIFISSFVNKKSYWKLGTFDYVCGGLSVVGIVLWLVTGEGVLAILLAIAADLLAGLPTLIKAFRYPETENYFGFLGGLVFSIITLLTITQWDIEHFGFPLYIFIFNSVMTLLIKFKIGRSLHAISNIDN